MDAKTNTNKKISWVSTGPASIGDIDGPIMGYRAEVNGVEIRKSVPLKARTIYAVRGEAYRTLRAALEAARR